MATQYQFRKATREQIKARIALIGPSGSGKTKSALLIAQGLGQRIAVIDTEHGSASKYAGQGIDFDVLELDSFAPRTYVQAMEAAARGGFDVLIIDSLSHAWMGKDGALEMVDNAAKRSQSGNSFMAWRDVTPEHNRLVDAMCQFPGHLIVTMRAKTEWVIDEIDRGGKTIKVPRKIGLAPIQRDGLDYEFDVVGDLTLDHTWMITKTRCEAFDGALITKPGAEFAATMLAWLNTGDVPRQRQHTPPPAIEPSNTQQPARRATRPVDGHRDSERPPSTTQPSQPPPAQPRPPAGPCAARFSAAAEWIGADDWNGRPLSEASLTVLLAYDEALGHAIANPKNKARVRALLMHREGVSTAIKAAEPPAGAQRREPGQDDAALAEAAANGGWDLSGQGASNDDLPKH